MSESRSYVRWVSVALLSVAALLTGCEQGGVELKPEQTTISGRAVAGPFVSGLVKAFKTTDTGQKATGASALLAQGVTDKSGNYEIVVFDRFYRGAVLIEVTGNYKDEAKSAGEDGGMSSTGGTPLVALAADFAPGKPMRNLQVTPLSLFAARFAQKLGATAGRLTAALVRDANRQAALALGLSELAATGGDAVAAANPIDVASGGGSGDSLRYGILLAGLAQLSKDRGVEQVRLLETMADDLAADGLLDGAIAGKIVSLESRLGAAVPYSAGLVTTQLVGSISTFLGSGNNRSGVPNTGDTRIAPTLGELTAPQPPSAAFTTSTTRAALGEIVRLDASTSTSFRAGVVLNYSWSVNRNGFPVTNSRPTAAVTTFLVTGVGSYFCNLTVDDGRVQSRLTKRVEVGTTTLAIESLTFTSEAPVAGTSTTAMISVRNTGPATAIGVFPTLNLSRGTAGQRPELKLILDSLRSKNTPPGGLVTFTIPIRTESSAGLGPVTATCTAAGLNTDASPAATRVLSVTAAPLGFRSIVPTATTIARGGRFVATVIVDNSNSSPATTGLAVSVTGTGFTARPRAVPPATVPASGTALFEFDVICGLTDGTFNATVTAAASILGTNVTGTQLLPGFVQVIPPAPLVLVSVVPATVTTAQGGRFVTTVIWRNPNPLSTASGVLPSIGGANLTATPRSTNPLVIATESVAAFVFDVTAGGAVGASDVIVGIGGTVAGRDVAASQPIQSLLTVTAPLPLSFVSVTPTVASTAQGERTLSTFNFRNPNLLPFSVTGAVTLTGSGFTATVRPGNSTSVAAGAIGTFAFDVVAGGTVGTFDGRVAIAGNVSGSGGTGSRVASGFLQVTPARPLVVESISPTVATTPQGGRRSVTVRVRNPNALATSADVTATLTGTGFTAVARVGNPSSVAAAGTADLNFDVTAGSTVGSFDARAAVGATLGGTNVGANRLFAGAIAVVAARRLTFVSVTPSTVTTVQLGRFVATAQFRNDNGLPTAAGATATLTGTGFIATARAGNSTTLAAGAVGTFAFDVTATLSTGPFAAIAAVSNSLGGTDVSTSQTISNYLVTVARPILTIAAVTPTRSTVSTGQTTRVNLIVQNTGAAQANLAVAPALAFRQGATVVTSQFASAPAPAVTAIPANSTSTIPFDVTPSGTATAFGTLTLGATVTATSAVQASFDASVTTTNAGSWTLRRAAIAANIGGSLTAPSGIDRGSASPVDVKAALSSTNANDATFTATSQALVFAIGGVDVSSQYVTTLAPGTSFPFDLAASASRVVTFQVNALASAVKAADVAITATIRGRDANSGVAVNVTRTGSWIVRDAAASVLGQTDLAAATPGTTQVTLKQPSAFLVHGGRLFVADQGNHRVLVYPSATATTPTVVLGQSSFTVGNVNGGVTPQLATMSAPASLAATTVGSNHILYVSDQGNHRILVFHDVDNKTTGDGALFALGQPSGVSAAANRGITTVGPDRFSSPGGLVVTGSRLVVADTGNNRVLVFQNIQSVSPATAATYAAAIALGQPKLTSGATAALTSNGSLSAPTGLACAGDRLAVADTLASRVLVFNTLSTRVTNGTTAQVVLGKSNFTDTLPAASAGRMAVPQGVWVNRNKLYVADTGNNRVLVFGGFSSLGAADSGRSADDLFGQALFGQSGINNAVTGVVDAFSAFAPSAVFSDSVGSDAVRVVDRTNNRILLVPLP